MTAPLPRALGAISPLGRAERCSHCWMQDHCWNGKCPCDCAAWVADVADLADALDLDAGVADALSRSGLDRPDEAS